MFSSLPISLIWREAKHFSDAAKSQTVENVAKSKTFQNAAKIYINRNMAKNVKPFSNAADQALVGAISAVLQRGGGDGEGGGRLGASDRPCEATEAGGRGRY